MSGKEKAAKVFDLFCGSGWVTGLRPPATRFSGTPTKMNRETNVGKPTYRDCDYKQAYAV